MLVARGLVTLLQTQGSRRIHRALPRLGAGGEKEEQQLARRDYRCYPCSCCHYLSRYIFPEFLPDPYPSTRNSVAERLARYLLVY